MGAVGRSEADKVSTHKEAMDEVKHKKPQSPKVGHDDKMKGSNKYLGKQKKISTNSESALSFVNGAKRQKIQKENSLVQRQVNATNVETIISSSHPCHSGDRLESNCGSIALNAFLSNHNGTGSNLTPGHVLQIIDSISPKILVPPQGSPLHRIVHEMRTLMKKQDSAASEAIAWSDYREEVIEPGQRPDDFAGEPRSYRAISSKKKSASRHTFEDPAGMNGLCISDLLSATYRNICMQEVDKGSFYGRQVQDVSLPALLEKFQTLENKFCESQMREDKIVGEGRKLGLVDYKRINSMKGYLDPIPPHKGKKP